MLIDFRVSHKCESLSVEVGFEYLLRVGGGISINLSDIEPAHIVVFIVDEVVFQIHRGHLVLAYEHGTSAQTFLRSE